MIGSTRAVDGSQGLSFGSSLEFMDSYVPEPRERAIFATL
jgi:hypothetical protein